MSSPPVQNTPNLWRNVFPLPQGDTHKYLRGHLIAFGGTVMTGAARLSARAAQRIGAGIVTLLTEKEAQFIYATALESVLVRVVQDINTLKETVKNARCDALLIGPGLGCGETKKSYVRAFLETKMPCVLDADALNNFENDPEELFLLLHEDCVLTPHEGEFSRLFGKYVDARQAKAERALSAAKIAKAVIVLKGLETYIAEPGGRLVLNNNAPSWLATAGAGDVLAGMLGGLLAQHMKAFEAALASTWIHGEIARDFGVGLIAEDLVLGIPSALKSLFQP